ncbi:2-phospho-L-lactate guanylyltransferase [Streptomyces sp. NPDC059095]|uniref:2-phospho-L-lactate guanylyltransferase n=1 Tax=Streptomyces sp. NPDC059095 TaxID=3346726 RepID=UPI0036ADF357
MPLKPLALAKSRLAAAVGDELRPRLALAFARDTVTAALACPAVRDVAGGTGDRPAGGAQAARGAPRGAAPPRPRPPPPAGGGGGGAPPPPHDRLAGAELAALGARVVPDSPGAGLNAALAHGAHRVRARRAALPVAALNADLPALRPTELGRVLAAAGAFPRAFLADAAGIGTTFLSALPGKDLDPFFGGPSRTAHSASGATEILLADVDTVRRDVDTGADLRTALALGVGPSTTALLGALDPVKALG